MTRVDDFQAALEAGDSGRIRALLQPLTEPERAELQAVARAEVAARIKEDVAAIPRLGPTLLAAYGTLPASDLRKLGWRSLHLPDDLEDVLRGRSPERLEPIVALLLDVAGGRAWHPVRTLVREGVIAPPDGPAYTLALLQATQYRPAALVVADDPGVLELEAWRLFEVEGGGEHSLAGYAKYTGDSWGDLFRELAGRDEVMRARLLDESLGALARDFGAFRAGWFSRFHESLEPTDDERAERSAAYLRLLRSRTRPTVSFATAALTRVADAGRLEPGALLGSVGPVLTEAPAGTAKTALKLVGQAGAHAAYSAEAAQVATSGLSHPSADVQRATLKLIDRLVSEPDVAVAAALADRIDDVAPSQRAGAEAMLVRLGGATRPKVEATERSGSVPEPMERRPAELDPRRMVVPIVAVDELVDVAVRVIEHGEPAEDIERVLHAVGRMPSERSEASRRATAALARRCRTILERPESRPFEGTDVQADVAAVLLAWASGERIPASTRRSTDPGVGVFLSARADEVAQAAADAATFDLVSLPTHIGGWIDPPELVERLLTRAPASRLDLVAAILRLAPGRRTEARRQAADIEGEAGAAVRYALGGDEAIGSTTAWWVAAARVRRPGEDDDALERAHPRLGPDAGLAARARVAEADTRMGGTTLVLEVEPEPPSTVDPSLPTVLQYQDAAARSWTGPSSAATLRWNATVQPADREAWAAVASVVMARNVDWWSAEWANRVYLEPFLEPWTSIGPHGRRLLGVALGAKEAGERGLAADVVRLALTDGRLDAGSLADGLGAAAIVGCDRPARWALSMADVATASGTHAQAVAQAIGSTLPAVVDRRPAALVPLLRLLDELLAAGDGSPSTTSLEALGALGRRGGQTGRLARSILARG